ncbi:hypothetical protein JBE04_39910 [Streptomyces sp. PRKS01-29]|nr:hypothetical protein [Streptomyces sabulosicollis]MBI0300462.1 hypothetical protein [Streptomyces sabulosicollis]
MTDTNPAALLRAAAEKIRKLAGQADQGPWETTWRGQEYHLDGYRDGDLHPVSEWTYAVATWEPQASVQRTECDTANADYMAAMHPGVGETLAGWLDSAAVDAEQIGPDPGALAVARQILGGES